MLINKFNSNLFNLLSESLYIIDFYTEAILFENNIAKDTFKIKNDFYDYFKEYLDRQEIISFFEQKDIYTDMDVIKIDNVFKHKLKYYLVFLKLAILDNKKVIIYLFKEISEKNQNEFSSDNFDIKKVEETSEIYQYIERLFELISKDYEDLSISNKDGLNTFLKNLSLKEVNKIGVAYINVNDFNTNECNKNGLWINIEKVLEKFFRSKDIYRLEEDKFMILCEDISKITFYQKIQRFNNYILSEKVYSYSIGFTWEPNLKDVYAIIKKAEYLMQSAYEAYLKKSKEKRVYSVIALNFLKDYKKIQIIVDLDTSLTFSSNNFSYNSRLDNFYANVRKMLKTDKKFVMLMLDINNFKSINELYGYKKGNEVLEMVNNILMLNIQNKGVCVHFHSDVYYVFSESDSDEETIKILHSINTDIKTIFKEMNISLFYGVYRIEDTAIPVESMCERANYAHKTAKKGNSKNLIFYYSDIKDNLRYEKEIENDMENAIKENQLELYLQPKYNILTETINGAEALVRWNHPIKGIIQPYKFIPIFEKNGFIIKLDFYILDKTCNFIKNQILKNEKVVPISVNMSKLHFNIPSFKNDLLKIIEKYEIPKSLIEIEVTESLLTENIEEINNTIKELKEKGLKISIDDFGSGYSSLGLLKDVDVDTLKIDRSFLKNFKSNKRAELIIRHIVSLANALDMKVVAEGVETQEEVNYLKEINCVTIQGFYFSKPIPLKEYEELIKKY